MVVQEVIGPQLGKAGSRFIIVSSDSGVCSIKHIAMGPPPPAHTVRGVAKLPPQRSFVLHVDIWHLELPVRNKWGCGVPGLVLHIQPAAVVGVRSTRGSRVPHGDMRAAEAGDGQSPL